MSDYFFYLYSFVNTKQILFVTIKLNFKSWTHKASRINQKKEFWLFCHTCFQAYRQFYGLLIIEGWFKIHNPTQPNIFIIGCKLQSRRIHRQDKVARPNEHNRAAGEIQRSAKLSLRLCATTHKAVKFILHWIICLIISFHKRDFRSLISYTPFDSCKMVFLHILISSCNFCQIWIFIDETIYCILFFCFWKKYFEYSNICQKIYNFWIQARIERYAKWAWKEKYYK